MDWGISGRTFVVTGGTSGIGLSCVNLLLDSGANVALCGRNAAKLSGVDTALKQKFLPERYLVQGCDVLQSDQVAEFAAAVELKFGGAQSLICNAGGGRLSTFATTDDESWMEELRLKYFSVIHPVRAFLPSLKLACDGAITVTNSLLALQPEPHMVCTSSARAGQLNLVHSLAKELAPDNIRVNSILIGTVASGQWERRYQERAEPGVSYQDWLKTLTADKKIPLGRFGEPEEAAKALIFLSSPAASYTTGTALDVSGGLARHI